MIRTGAEMEKSEKGIWNKNKKGIVRVKSKKEKERAGDGETRPKAQGAHADKDKCGRIQSENISGRLDCDVGKGKKRPPQNRSSASGENLSDFCLPGGNLKYTL